MLPRIQSFQHACHCQGQPLILAKQDHMCDAGLGCHLKSSFVMGESRGCA